MLDRVPKAARELRQIEANIACEEMGVVFPGIGPVTYRIPLSLSFDSMDEGEFRQTARAFCAYIADKYWPDLDPEAIEEMAESFVDEV